MRVTVYDEHAQELNRAASPVRAMGKSMVPATQARGPWRRRTNQAIKDRDAELRQPDHQRRRDIESNEKNG